MKAIIGGTGLNQLPGMQDLRERCVESAWDERPVTVFQGRFHDQDVLFLPRHGVGHRLPPHRINYRANVDALKLAGASEIVAVVAVGGIRRDLPPAALAIPADIIDYTYGRGHSYCDGESDAVQHIEFAPPYSERLRDSLLAAAGEPLPENTVLGVTQGPRLESAAEIRRMQRDGCDMVGMTSMPEAALAREAGMDYANLAVVVNWAAGIGEGAIHAEIEQSIAQGMARVECLLAKWVGA